MPDFIREKSQEELDQIESDRRRTLRELYRGQDPPLEGVKDALNPAVEIFLSDHNGLLKFEVEARSVFDVHPA